MDSGKVSVRAAVVQCLAAFSIASVTGLTGCIFAWPSYNVANFVTNETVLSEPMTSVHVTLLGSLTNIGAFVVTPFCGVALNKLGRKYTSMIAGVPYVLAWAIISVTNSVPLVLAAMGLAGVGTGCQAGSSVYISEIAHDSIRGALTSSVVAVYFIGLLISYVIGGNLTYSQVIYVQLTIAILYILSVSLLKDSPIFLMQNGREKEAAESLAFYRQTSVTSKEVEVELAKIRLQLDPKLEKVLEAEDPTITKDLLATPEQNPETAQPQQKLSEWQFLKKSQTSIRALFTGVVSMTVMILMGNITMQVYAETLFRDAVPSLDSNQCSIFLAVDLLVASLVCTLLIDRLGRRFLMVYTCLGSSVCTLVLGTQIQLHWAPHWFTVVLIYVYNFVFNVGVAVIPYVLCAELFLPEVRGLCSSIIMSTSWFMNFITLVIFTPAVEEYGFGPLFYAFTIVGFLGAAFCYFYQPETSGLSVNEIQGLFMKKTKRKVGV